MISVKKVSHSMTNRRIFRTLSRDNCGESMEPEDTEQIFFGFKQDNHDLKEMVVACASLKLASKDCLDTTVGNFQHVVTFIFVHRDYKRQGIGKFLLSYLEVEAFNFLPRPIRVESARKAVGFFSKSGYIQVGEPKETCAGSDLFRFLYTMEKNCPFLIEEELWDT
nr:uncharacterized protein LOC124815680 [Hydra vulgaris]